MVINKRKADEYKDKILFINADAEYGEGKAQNYLRPEDIEKIDTVYTKKLPIKNYSRLVPLSEIRKYDYNLNIRRYVDNTPDPEPEDVTAHLVGGVPKSEVEAKQKMYDKFDLTPDVLFEPKDDKYYNFKSSITDKQQIKEIIDNNPSVQDKIEEFATELSKWWETAQNEVIGLTKEKSIPDIRTEMLGSLQHRLLPLKVFDVFQIAGIFVNWWQDIYYDFKTINSVGWSVNLIPDEYIKKHFFQAEVEELEQLDTQISEAESDLTEAVENSDGLNLILIKTEMKRS